MTLKSGHDSSEHRRSLRAEAIGTLLVVAGLVLLVLGYGYPAVAVAALGALLVGHTASSYAASRGNVKAAAARPAAVHAQPRI